MTPRRKRTQVWGLSSLFIRVHIYQESYGTLEGLFDLVPRKVSQTKPEAGSRGRLLLAEVKE